MFTVILTKQGLAIKNYYYENLVRNFEKISFSS